MLAIQEMRRLRYDTDLRFTAGSFLDVDIAEVQTVETRGRGEYSMLLNSLVMQRPRLILMIDGCTA